MPTAFKATYSDWKLVKTRGVVQIVFEVPLAEADAAYDILGGMPNHANEKWFGIAALKAPQQEEGPAAPHPEPPSPQPDGAKGRIDWREVQPAAQAGIRANDPIFRAFLSEKHFGYVGAEIETAELIREFCHVKSRSELSSNHKARVMWKQLDDEFSIWKAMERVS